MTRAELEFLEGIPSPEAAEAERSKRPGLGFLHVTRSGGEYLSRKIGLGRFDPAFVANDPLTKVVRAGWAPPWHRIPTPEVLILRKNWFTVVRNPYDRVASEIAFENILRSNMSSLQLHGGRVVADGSEVEIPSRNLPTNYEELLSYNLPEEGHFAMQAPMAKSVKNVVRHESMPKEVNALMVKWGYPEIDFSDWQPKAAKKLTDAQKKIIFEKYKTDFEELGYLK